MTTDDFRVIKYLDAKSNRFSFWVIFQNRKDFTSAKHRKAIINFFTPLLGPLGIKWQYERNAKTFLLKLDNEADATMVVLKYQKN